MVEPFIGEIRLFGFNFAPRNWALCDGSILQTRDNEPLFSLISTIYGGDGRTTFGLPDLRGRTPIHKGSGIGLSNRPIGHKSGTETVTLTTNQMPAHRHTMHGEEDIGTLSAPATDSLLGELEFNGNPINFYSSTTPSRTLATTALNNTGGNNARENLMPYLTMNYCIALLGLFPTRT